jgi:hypothetical protein
MVLGKGHAPLVRCHWVGLRDECLLDDCELNIAKRRQHATIRISGQGQL